MKNISEFHSSWTQIEEVIHDMKNALTVLKIALNNQKVAAEQIQTAMKRIIEGLEIIDKSINRMANNEK